jgi:hypothetical protein
MLDFSQATVTAPLSLLAIAGALSIGLLSTAALARNTSLRD